MEDLIERIIDESIPTGSRTFGGFTDNSDYDYIVNRSVFKLCWKVLDNIEYERLEYSSQEVYSYAFVWNGKKINFLIMKSGHYNRWINATKRMVELKEKGVIYQNKNDRVKAFEEFKDD